MKEEWRTCLVLKQFILQKKKSSDLPIKKERDLHLRPYFSPPVHFVQSEMKEKDLVSKVDKAPDSD